MNRTLFALFLIAVFCPTLSKAQITLDSAEFHHHFQKRLNEIHFQLMDGALNEDIPLYWNDSFSSTYSKQEILDRLESRYIEIENGQIADEYLNRDKDPAIAFTYSISNQFKPNSIKIELSGVAPKLELVVAGIDLGLTPFVWYTTKDVPQVLGTDEYRLLVAMQQCIRNNDIFRPIYYEEPTRYDELNWRLSQDYWDQPAKSELDSSRIPEICFRSEKVLNHAIYRLKNLKTSDEVTAYSDSQLQNEMKKGDWNFRHKLKVSIQDPEVGIACSVIDTIIVYYDDVFDYNTDFSLIFVEEKAVLVADMGDAKNWHGHSKIYVPFQSLNGVLQEWDYIILKDFIEHNTVK